MAQAIPPLVIAHVQTRFLRAGAEENTWASCLHQVRAGHRVHMLCGRESDMEHYRRQASAVQLQEVPSLVREVSPSSDLGAYRELVGLFRTIRPDIVHTHTSKAGIIGRLAAKRAGVPVIIQGVHMLPFSNIGLAEKLFYLAAEHLVAPVTDHFIHVSEGTRGAYRAARVGQRIPHSVVRSGMNIEGFVDQPPPEDWRRLLGVGDNEPRPPTILMLAALEARKRHAEFLHGFAAATTRGERIRLLLAGEGPEAADVAAVVERLDLGDRVKLLGFRSDAARIVAMADIGVLASLREGLPRVVVQYLAGGKPAVVSPLQGIEEIVRDGVNGIIVASRQAEAAAREAVDLVRDTARLARLAQGARNSPVEEWTFASMFAQLDAAYRTALSSARAQRRLAARHPAVMPAQQPA